MTRAIPAPNEENEVVITPGESGLPGASREIPAPSGEAAQEEDGQGDIFSDAWESIKSFGSGVKQTVTGEGVELEFPSVTELTEIDDNSIGFWESWPVNLKLGLVRDNAAKAEVLSSHFEGDKRFGGMFSDKFNNPMVVWNGQPYYLNKPGLTTQDYQTFAGEILKYLPASKYVSGGKSALGTIVRGVPSYTATEVAARGGESLIAPKASADKKQSLGDIAGESATLGAMSAGAEAVLPWPLRQFARGIRAVVAPAANTVFPHISKFPGKFKDVISKSEFLGETLSDAFPPAVVSESKYPLTIGQRTSPPPGGVTPTHSKLVEEEDIIRYAPGTSPKSGGTETIRAFDDVQLGQIRDDAIALQDEFGSGTMSGARSADEFAGRVPLAAAESAQSVVAKEASDLKAKASAGYKAARLAEDAPVMTPEGVVDTATRMRNSVFDSRDGLGYTRAEIADMPLLARELKSVARAVNIFSKKGAREVPLNYLHGVQKRLNRAISSADARSPQGVALMAMKKELDGAITRGIDEGFMSGSPKALQQLKEATGLYSQYLGLTGKGKMPKGPRARAAAVLQKMSDQDYTALELARTLFGHAKFNPNQSMRLVIKQLKKSLPEDQYDEVISYLKDGILEKAFTNPKGEIKRQAIVNNYNDVFIANKQIVEELFSPEEIARITQFRKDVFPTLWSEIKLNPSGSGYIALGGLAKAGLLSTGLRVMSVLPVAAEAGKALQRHGAASQAREAVRQYLRKNQTRWITIPASAMTRTVVDEEVSNDPPVSPSPAITTIIESLPESAQEKLFNLR